MPALVSYWEGAILHFPLNQYTPRSTRKEQRAYDRHLYRERHLVECFIGKIKHYRRIFSRFEKLASRYLGFLSFVGVLVWLR